MTQDTPDISVVVCTYTEARWADLVEAVDSIRRQIVPCRELIIVVDHNQALFERVRDQFEEATVVENQEPRGLSGARNTGVAIAKGTLVAFLDDDAIVERDWVEKFTECLENPELLGVGTRIDPLWENEQPAWLPDEYYWVVGCSYRGLPLTQAPIRNLSGGSMCLRREIFEEVGGFRVGIGRTSTRPLGCEETELCIRAGQHWPQKIFLYDPGIRIQHRVPASRARWSYFCARCYAEGQSKALVSSNVGAGDGLASERMYVLKTLPQGVVRGLADTFFRHDLMGLARAGSIVAGLVITIAGYCQLWVSQRMAGRPKNLDVTLIASRHSDVDF